MKLVAYITASGLTGLGPRPEREDQGHVSIPHHVTVLHTSGLITKAGIEPDPRLVRWIVRRAVRGCAPGDLWLGGLVELGGETDAQKAIATRVYGMVVRQLRERIITGLAEFGIIAPQTHDTFIPHLTLAYIPRADRYEGPTPIGSFTARSVRWRLDDDPFRTVMIGGADGNPKTALTSRPAPVRALFRAVDWGDWLAERAAEELAKLAPDAVPEGWHVGRSFVYVSEGEVYCRYSGQRRGLAVTADDLDSIVSIFTSGESACAIDWEHEEATPIGVVLAMWRVVHNGKEAIACLPAYDSRGQQLVGKASHLWSSPHIEWAGPDDSDAFVEADSGQPQGRCRVPHLAVCVDPAQSHRVLTAVRLSDPGRKPAPPPSDDTEIDATEQEDAQMDELMEMMKAQGAKLDALVAEVADLKAKVNGEKPEAEAEQAEGGAEEKPEGEKPEEEMSAKTAAEMAALREKVRITDRNTRMSAAIQSGRMKPASRKAWEASFDRDGGATFAEVIESAAKWSAIPQPKGHGEVNTTVNLSDDDPIHAKAVSLQASAKAAGKPISYTAALQRANTED